MHADALRSTLLHCGHRRLHSDCHSSRISLPSHPVTLASAETILAYGAFLRAAVCIYSLTMLASAVLIPAAGAAPRQASGSDAQAAAPSQRADVPQARHRERNRNSVGGTRVSRATIRVGLHWHSMPKVGGFLTSVPRKKRHRRPTAISCFSSRRTLLKKAALDFLCIVAANFALEFLVALFQAPLIDQ
eukprot:3541635-Pleurochrysis_carterae.AAC.3